MVGAAGTRVEFTAPARSAKPQDHPPSQAAAIPPLPLSSEASDTANNGQRPQPSAIFAVPAPESSDDSPTLADFAESIPEDVINAVESDDSGDIGLSWLVRDLKRGGAAKPNEDQRHPASHIGPEQPKQRTRIARASQASPASNDHDENARSRSHPRHRSHSAGLGATDDAAAVSSDCSQPKAAGTSPSMQTKPLAHAGRGSQSESRDEAPALSRFDKTKDADSGTLSGPAPRRQTRRSSLKRAAAAGLQSGRRRLSMTDAMMDLQNNDITPLIGGIPHGDAKSSSSKKQSSTMQAVKGRLRVNPPASLPTSSDDDGGMIVGGGATRRPARLQVLPGAASNSTIDGTTTTLEVGETDLARPVRTEDVARRQAAEGRRYFSFLEAVAALKEGFPVVKHAQSLFTAPSPRMLWLLTGTGEASTRKSREAAATLQAKLQSILSIRREETQKRVAWGGDSALEVWPYSRICYGKSKHVAVSCNGVKSFMLAEIVAVDKGIPEDCFLFQASTTMRSVPAATCFVIRAVGDRKIQLQAEDVYSRNLAVTYIERLVEAVTRTRKVLPVVAIGTSRSAHNAMDTARWLERVDQARERQVRAVLEDAGVALPLTPVRSKETAHLSSADADFAGMPEATARLIVRETATERVATHTVLGLVERSLAVRVLARNGRWHNRSIRILPAVEDDGASSIEADCVGDAWQPAKRAPSSRHAMPGEHSQVLGRTQRSESSLAGSEGGRSSPDSHSTRPVSPPPPHSRATAGGMRRRRTRGARQQRHVHSLAPGVSGTAASSEEVERAKPARVPVQLAAVKTETSSQSLADQSSMGATEVAGLTFRAEHRSRALTMAPQGARRRRGVAHNDDDATIRDFKAPRPRLHAATLLTAAHCILARRDHQQTIAQIEGVTEASPPLPETKIRPEDRAGRTQPTRRVGSTRDADIGNSRGVNRANQPADARESGLAPSTSREPPATEGRSEDDEPYGAQKPSLLLERRQTSPLFAVANTAASARSPSRDMPADESACAYDSHSEQPESLHRTAGRALHPQTNSASSSEAADEPRSKPAVQDQRIHSKRRSRRRRTQRLYPAQSGATTSPMANSRVQISNHPGEAAVTPRSGILKAELSGSMIVKKPVQSSMIIGLESPFRRIRLAGGNRPAIGTSTLAMVGLERALPPHSSIANVDNESGACDEPGRRQHSVSFAEQDGASTPQAAKHSKLRDRVPTATGRSPPGRNKRGRHFRVFGTAVSVDESGTTAPASTAARSTRSNSKESRSSADPVQNAFSGQAERTAEAGIAMASSAGHMQAPCAVTHAGQPPPMPSEPDDKIDVTQRSGRGTILLRESAPTPARGRPVQTTNEAAVASKLGVEAGPSCVSTTRERTPHSPRSGQIPRSRTHRASDSRGPRSVSVSRAGAGIEAKEGSDRGFTADPPNRRLRKQTQSTGTTFRAHQGTADDSDPRHHRMLQSPAPEDLETGATAPPSLIVSSKPAVWPGPVQAPRPDELPTPTQPQPGRPSSRPASTSSNEHSEMPQADLTSTEHPSPTVDTAKRAVLPLADLGFSSRMPCSQRSVEAAPAMLRLRVDARQRSAERRATERVAARSKYAEEVRGQNTARAAAASTRRRLGPLADRDIPDLPYGGTPASVERYGAALLAAAKAVSIAEEPQQPLPLPRTITRSYPHQSPPQGRLIGATLSLAGPGLRKPTIAAPVYDAAEGTPDPTSAPQTAPSKVLASDRTECAVQDEQESVAAASPLRTAPSRSTPRSPSPGHGLSVVRTPNPVATQPAVLTTGPATRRGADTPSPAFPVGKATRVASFFAALRRRAEQGLTPVLNTAVSDAPTTYREQEALDVMGTVDCGLPANEQRVGIATRHSTIASVLQDESCSIIPTQTSTIAFSPREGPVPTNYVRKGRDVARTHRGDGPTGNLSKVHQFTPPPGGSFIAASDPADASAVGRHVLARSSLRPQQAFEVVLMVDDPKRERQSEGISRSLTPPRQCSTAATSSLEADGLQQIRAFQHADMAHVRRDANDTSEMAVGDKDDDLDEGEEQDEDDEDSPAPLGQGGARRYRHAAASDNMSETTIDSTVFRPTFQPKGLGVTFERTLARGRWKGVRALAAALDRAATLRDSTGRSLGEALTAASNSPARATPPNEATLANG